MRSKALRDRRALTTAAMLAAAGGTAMADFTFSDFQSVDQLIMLGDAGTEGAGEQSTLSITSGGFQTSSVWHNERQHIAEPWSTEFTFTVSDLNITGADGFAFVMQNAGADMHEDTSFGQGGGLAYNMGSNLVAVVFDMWENAPANDPNANHVSIQNAGPGVTSSHQDDSLGVATDVPDMSSGEAISVLISYEPGTMRVSMNGEQVIESALDLGTALDSDGFAWIGFTGAGTAAWQSTEIHDWGFEGTPVPSPAGVALLGLGGLVAGRRRR